MLDVLAQSTSQCQRSRKQAKPSFCCKTRPSQGKVSHGPASRGRHAARRLRAEMNISPNLVHAGATREQNQRCPHTNSKEDVNKTSGATLLKQPFDCMLASSNTILPTIEHRKSDGRILPQKAVPRAVRSCACLTNHLAVALAAA